MREKIYYTRRYSNFVGTKNVKKKMACSSNFPNRITYDSLNNFSVGPFEFISDKRIEVKIKINLKISVVTYNFVGTDFGWSVDRDNKSPKSKKICGLPLLSTLFHLINNECGILYKGRYKSSI